MSERIIDLPFDVKLLPVQTLRAGDISCLYEKGNLRYIRFGDEELVRMIYSAVRNINWRTATYEIEDEQIHKEERSFEISYSAIYQLDDIHYKAHISIQGKEDNSISFHMKGEALCIFKTKRIGLCVHHPIETCMGKEVSITCPDKSSYTTLFPDYISAHQPFKNVQEMIWTTDQNNTVHLIFEGDVFETEDQRNWTDNSYKTYSPPLDKASPVLVSKGETMEQVVQLSVAKTIKPPVKKAAYKPETPEVKVPFPAIGYSRINGSKPLSKTETVLLKNIPFDHYRVELKMYAPQWQDELLNAVSEVEGLNTLLELIIFFSSSFEAEADQLLPKLRECKVKIKSLLVLQADYNATPASLIQHVYPKFKQAFPAIEIGYGTNAFFAALNRNRPPGIEFDFVSFTMHPQVHATDARTIIENLASQQHVLNTITQFTSQPAYISLKWQENTNELEGDDTDLRFHTSFGAAWTLAGLKNLCQAGHLTFYQTTGKNGVINKSQIDSEDHSVLYNVLVQLKHFDPAFIILGGYDNKACRITFEDKSGGRLHYSLDPRFYSPYLDSF